VTLLRPVYESWLFQATQDELSSWQLALLGRALRKDEALRGLALELAEFNEDEAPAAEHAPDLRSRLRTLLVVEHVLNVERPLFPSAWVPAGAIAVLLITAWVALAVKPPAPAPVESSNSGAQAAEELAQSVLRPTVPVQTSQVKSSTALTASAAAGLSKTAIAAQTPVASTK